MKYLNRDYKDVQELKRHFLKLVKQYHPDISKEENATEIMKIINNEYEIMIKLVGAKEKTKDSKVYTEIPKEFTDLINNLMKMEGLDIEIIGSWVWVGGNTYENKEQLKALGFRYQRKSKQWYKGKFDDKYKKTRATSMEYKRNKYGSLGMKSEGIGQLA